MKDQSKVSAWSRIERRRKRLSRSDRISECTQWEVYNEVRCFEVDRKTIPARQVRLKADRLFDELVSDGFISTKRSDKIDAKRTFTLHLLKTLFLALYHDGCIRYSRRCCPLEKEVYQAFVKKKLLVEIRSPPGSPKQSRLIPTYHAQEYSMKSPEDVVEQKERLFVTLTDRETKLPIDHAGSSVFDYFQKRLTKINNIYGDYEITYTPYLEWYGTWGEEKLLVPTLTAKFIDDFNHGGRMYTNGNGHQGLSKLERATIRIDGQPTVEIDYSAMFPRMLYHLIGIDYQFDPYDLDYSIPKFKEAVKKILLIMLNSNSRQQAFRASSFEFGSIVVNEIMNKLEWKHKRISQFFFKDSGLRCMNLESHIALDILSWLMLVQNKTPCLPVHDSFIVPIQKTELLRMAMTKAYVEQLKYKPIIKPDRRAGDR